MIMHDLVFCTISRKNLFVEVINILDDYKDDDAAAVKRYG